MGKIINKTGNRYGRLIVMRLSSKKDKRNNIYWECLCDCGIIKHIRSSCLGKDNFSCGCLLKEKLKQGLASLPNGEAAKRELYGNYKRNALKARRCFELSIDEFEKLTKQNCFYCGIGPVQEQKASKTSYSYNGVDRVDNNIGYILSNCVSCCSICNIAKNNLSIVEFKNWINRLIQYNTRD